MFIRVLHIKFPNELAKKSVIALSRSVTKEQFSNGLLIRLHADTSANSCMIILLWKTVLILMSQEEILVKNL